MAARQLRLIGPPAVIHAIGEARVHLVTAEVEVRLTRMAHRPAANAVVQIEQAGLVGHFLAGPCGHEAARRGRGDGGLLIAGPLTQEATGAD